MHTLNFDHGFNLACPSGNHMLEDSIFPKVETGTWTCDECGFDFPNMESSYETEDNEIVCQDCFERPESKKNGGVE